MFDEINKYYIKEDINKFLFCNSNILKITLDCISYFLLFIILFFIIINIKNSDNKFRVSLYIIGIIYGVLFLINQKMKTNLYINNIYISPENIVNDLNTGDIIFFRYL